jgi:hypothetical protein
VKLSLYQALQPYASCEVRTQSTYKTVKLSLYHTVKSYASCEVRTQSTYKRVNLSLYQAVEPYASCEVRTQSTYKTVKLSPYQAVEPYASGEVRKQYKYKELRLQSHHHHRHSLSELGHSRCVPSSSRMCLSVCTVCTHISIIRQGYFTSKISLRIHPSSISRTRTGSYICTIFMLRHTLA